MPLLAALDACVFRLSMMLTQPHSFKPPNDNGAA
jgi:hypothetical protein